jgi:hypothetical protein
MTYLPLRGLYHNLSARGILVFCPALRDSHILTLGFLRKPALRTASHLTYRILQYKELHQSEKKLTTRAHMQIREDSRRFGNQHLAKEAAD